MKQLLTGNEAIARGAWEAGVKVVSGYPGTPSTEILENLSKFYKDDIFCEWAPNEKVGFEVAIGASSAGARAMTTMKHVGLNVAADPLMTFAYIGAVGGFVAVVADDPGMNSSQNEQDTREFAKFAKIPVIEPSDSAEALAFTKEAFEISEKFGTPVILRSTTTLSHSRGSVETGERKVLNRAIHFEKDPPRYVPIPAWARPMHKRLLERLTKLQEAASVSTLNRIEWKDRRIGIITHGVAYQHVREVFPEASVLKLGWCYPWPDKLFKEFANGVDRVVVVEELEGLIEEHVKALGISCVGKKLGDDTLVPRLYEINVDVLLEVRHRLTESGIYPFEPSELMTTKKENPNKDKIPPLPPRPPVLCPGCPHRGIFYALGRFDVVVTGDIGCYTLGVAPPLNRIDTTTCMGAGVTMAHGMEKAGNDRRVIGIVGDSTFFHSGITGLLDIGYNKGKSITIVLDNRITAMTGHQDNPGTGKTIVGEETFAASVSEIGRAVGIKNIAEVNPFKLNETVAVLKEAINSDEAWLIVSKAPCPLAYRQIASDPLSVNQDKCKKCKACLKLGCPGIEKEGNEIRINQLLCNGCGLCSEVCAFGALGCPAK